MKIVFAILFILFLYENAFAVIEPKWGNFKNMTMDEIQDITFVAPNAKMLKTDVHMNTLVGKVMCGYQGWFTAVGDGTEIPWRHYAWKDGFKPGSVSVDFWPDVSEYEDLYDTPFTYPDGSVAKTFSSADLSTVRLHFKWMKEYGIDGAFVQRFVCGLTEPFKPEYWNLSIVLHNARIGARENGRAIAISYDFAQADSSVENVGDLVINDWITLNEKAKLAKDPAYLKHQGKPVVQMWVAGTNDAGHQKYSLDDFERIVDFFKNDPKYGNCYVICGVPTGWHDGVGDSYGKDHAKYKQMMRIIKKCDAMTTWGPGRYNSPEDFEEKIKMYYSKDIKWCNENNKLYFPAVFPGFSWHNMIPESPLNAIPRAKGDFLWSQFVGYYKQGVKAIFVAMFDEIDEGTAVFKCTNNPPNGNGSEFAAYEGLPSDYYLKLVGEGKKLINGELKSLEKPDLK